MPMEEINPDGSRVVEMLEKLQEQQEANKEEILRRMDGFQKQTAEDMKAIS
jgi:hypothetical protein